MTSRYVMVDYEPRSSISDNGFQGFAATTTFERSPICAAQRLLHREGFLIKMHYSHISHRVAV